MYWVDASSVTIDSGVSDPTTFLGNILALTSITMGADATDACGRLLAETGDVTLISDTIGNNCTALGLNSNGLSGGSSTSGGTSPIPEPSSLALFGGGLLGLLVLAVQQRRVRLPQSSRRARSAEDFGPGRGLLGVGESSRVFTTSDAEDAAGKAWAAIVPIHAHGEIRTAPRR